MGQLEDAGFELVGKGSGIRDGIFKRVKEPATHEQTLAGFIVAAVLGSVELGRRDGLRARECARRWRRCGHFIIYKEVSVSLRCCSVLEHVDVEVDGGVDFEGGELGGG